MRKKGILQLALQLNFWVALNTCNSPYVYIVNAIGQVAKVAIHRIYGAIHYNFVATTFFNYYAIPLWLQS
jgi:hypothetical protein